MTRPSRGLAALLVLAAGSCTGRDAGEFPPDVVAVWDGGTLTVAELDRAVLELPPAERPSPTEPIDAWHEEFVRNLVLDRLLRREPDFAALRDSPEAAALGGEARRNAAYQLFLQRLPPIPEPTEEEVRRDFERDPHRQPARRRVSHIFLRTGEGRSPAEVDRELREIRRRVLAGEGFGRLASELSESETRHRAGLMGWVGPEQLGDLAETVFALPEDVPSEPFMTPQGGHLFYVDGVTEERSFDLAEVEEAVANRIRLERRKEQIERRTAGLPAPEGPSFRPTEDELRSLLEGGSPETVVLRTGDYRLDLRGLRRLLADSTGTADAVTRSTTLLAQLEQRERVYLQAETEGWLEEPLAVEGLEKVLDRALLRLELERELEQRVAASEDELVAYHAARRHRFTEPLRLHLRELRVPLVLDIADGVMRSLEEAAVEVTAGRESLASVRAELGGELRDRGWMTLQQLAMLNPSAAEGAAELAGIGCLPPFRSETDLHLLEVLDRREPTERPLADVRDEVERGYLAENRDRLTRELRDELLAEARFRLLVDDLTALAGREGLGE